MERPKPIVDTTDKKAETVLNVVGSTFSKVMSKPLEIAYPSATNDKTPTTLAVRATKGILMDVILYRRRS